MSDPDAIRCEGCDEKKDDCRWLTGEKIYCCRACMRHTRTCETCGRVYVSLAGLAEGCSEDDVMIHQDAAGVWCCVVCAAHKPLKDRCKKSISIGGECNVKR